jgi:NADH-quinone oxidoreductase subunit J
MGSTNITELGLSLFKDWAIPFELASLVLLIALIGAVVVVREDNEEDR